MLPSTIPPRDTIDREPADPSKELAEKRQKKIEKLKQWKRNREELKQTEELRRHMETLNVASGDGDVPDQTNHPFVAAQVVAHPIQLEGSGSNMHLDIDSTPIDMSINT